MWLQKTIALSPRRKGFHLITDELIKKIPELSRFQIGLAHFFIQHTSASLTLNENCDPDVRADMESHFNHFVPENARYYLHVLEGKDDMPAHIKTTTIGASLSVPVTEGRLALGSWQGIYLGEHRDAADSRKVIITLQGEYRMNPLTAVAR